jgi:hypothetical protein
MTGQGHSTLGRILRWLKPSAESFAAAAAVYAPDLMLQLKATSGAVEERPSPECDRRFREAGARGSGAAPPCLEVRECPAR